MAWVIGWSYLLPGFAHAVDPKIKVPAVCTQLYYLAYPLGFVVSFLAFYALNLLAPPPGLGVTDDFDVYGNFTEDEAAKRFDIGKAAVIESRSVEEPDRVPSMKHRLDHKSA